jgi:hypothetical protein
LKKSTQLEKKVGAALVRSCALYLPVSEGAPTGLSCLRTGPSRRSGPRSREMKKPFAKFHSYVGNLT